MKKAQVGTEYLMVMGFVSLILVPLVIVYFTSVQDTTDEIGSRQAINIARKIVDASESVYFLGEPSQTTLKVSIPHNIESASVNGREVVFVMKTKSGLSDLVQVSSVNMTGSLPNEPGQHLITIKAESDKVSISYS